MRTREVEWTILFNFPDGKVFPKENGFQSTLDTNVKVWTNKREAEKVAKEIAGKYSYEIVPTVTEVSVE